MANSPHHSSDAGGFTPAADSPQRRAQIERALFARRDKGDLRARDELIERFLPLAHSVARRYQKSGEPFDDLFQVASLALVKTVDRYDPARGCAFSSFAVPSIVGELKRHFRDRTWAVRPPRELQELTLRVDRAATQLSMTLDRAPTVSELAAEIGTSDELVLEALQASGGRSTVSLQAPVGGLDARPQLQDALGASDNGYDQADARVWVDALMSGLPRRSREILRMRFEDDLTQAEIGAAFGISQMQVSRIIRQAIGQLHEIADEPLVLA